MGSQLKFKIQGTMKEIESNIHSIFNAGYAGKNQESVRKHIEELAALGVPTPKNTPTLYPVSNYLAVQDKLIQVQHTETSGEVEYVLFWKNNDLYITVGSDHTDRKLESYNVPMSKQASPNVISTEAWLFDDVKDHWDQLELECWVMLDGEKQLYQKGTVSELMSPSDWDQYFSQYNIANNDNLFFSGTVNIVLQDTKFAKEYELVLHDPILNRSIRHSYLIKILPNAIE
ncbi:DUF2848 domain-containing protein [Terrilactibacillus laevilacticus]|uniref:DUF2848 domain-containing protein n=1 Tax=Terrilactibacillus laevilacticus TaxID=1380157 RepID=UPI0011463FBE|nr:DUF2848 domain-containing protein [Terrilactibacillus laevilacticus]